MISGFSQRALSQLQGALGGGSVTTVVIDFERLADEVAQLGATATKIAQAVSNPTWAAGDEFCRRAAVALENEWFDAAAEDAQRSTEAYPYRAAPHLFLALARLHQGDSTSAYESLLRAVDYGKAAEPGHAATAGLLAANLASAAGRSDAAAAVLLKARESTQSRCPALVVATQHLSPSDPADLCQLLKDDPAAWVGVSAPDSLFGGDGVAVRAAFDNLLTATSKLVLDAEEFARNTAQLTTTDVSFLDRVYDFGSSRYSGAADALKQYQEGGSMRMLSPYFQGLVNERDRMTLAVAVSAGHQILRYMAWRSPTQLPLSDDWLKLTFDLVSFEDSLGSNPEPDVLGTGPVRDILVTDWYSIDRDVRLQDLPRLVGEARGTGPYLRTLRAHDKFRRDANDLRVKVNELAAVPEPRGMRGRAYQQQNYDASRQEIALIQRFLAVQPPDPEQVQQVIADWVKITASTRESVIRPYAHISSPL